MKLEDFEGASNDFTKAIELEPKNAEAYFKRAISNKFLKNLTDSKKDLSKAAEIDISFSTSKYNYTDHNDIRVFIDDLTKAVFLNDKVAIAKMFNYPFIDYWGNDPLNNKAKSLNCKNSSELFEKFDKIFTKEIVKCILLQTFFGDYLNDKMIFLKKILNLTDQLWKKTNLLLMDFNMKLKEIIVIHFYL